MFWLKSFRKFFRKIAIFRNFDHWSEILSMSAGRPLGQGVCPSLPVSHKHMLSQPSFSSPLINEDLPAGPQLVFTLNNRFFRHQACYSLLPAKPGGQADGVISLCKYKVIVCDRPMDKVTIYVQTPNPKFCLYWSLIGFIDWRYSQSCCYLLPLL